MIYLKDKINELPKNCLFNKGKVGCGGTTLAIEGDQPYVIAVPYTSLTFNKVGQYPNGRCDYRLLGVSEGVSPNDIRSYLKEVKIPKIITTYDSLPKVIKAFEGDVSGINLLVDEYHILFTQYCFRREAVQNVLNSFRQFKSYTFMTATPLEKRFILDELKDIPIMSQVWNPDEQFNVTVKAIKCKDVMASASKLIKIALSEKHNGNIYFFVNSVRAIKELVAKNGLTKDSCRVIYSKSNPINVGIENSSIESPPKKINFLTSTVFEGCDIFDPEGRTVILSDPFYSHTLLDISTSISQIAGRIRNSKYIGEIIHLYKQCSYRDLSLDEYNAYIDEQIKTSKEVVATFNGLSDVVRASLTNEPSKYIQKTEDNYLFFDPNLPRIDQFNYQVINNYSSTVTLGEEYQEQTISVVHGKDDTVRLADYKLNDGIGIDNISFGEIIKEIRMSTGITRTILLNEAAAYYPFIREAISKLGFERISSLKYVQKDIKNELLMISDTTNEYKIFSKLNYSYGVFYSSSTIKEDLRIAYEQLGYTTRLAKATDIQKYYDVQHARKRVDGKQVSGYIILNPKFGSQS